MPSVDTVYQHQVRLDLLKVFWKPRSSPSVMRATGEVHLSFCSWPQCWLRPVFVKKFDCTSQDDNLGQSSVCWLKAHRAALTVQVSQR